MRIGLNFAVAAVVALAGNSPCCAQVPTATGRQISMSNPAWTVFIPSTYHQRPDNVADVLVHFHGNSQLVWNNAKYANLNAIIVTANHGTVSSHYSTPFSNASNPSAFQSLLNEALTKVRQQADISDTLTWDKLGVSSFSAGYGAVREILKSTTYRNEIDALLAADSLYATTAGDGTPLDSQMVDYKTFATLAKNDSKTFLFSHSQVLTFTYENTIETGDELLQHLGISASAYNVNGLGTLNFYRRAQSGNFHLLGALGADGDSHLEHLRYIGEFFEDLPLAKIPPTGDYNGDWNVDAADYVLWRKTLGDTVNLVANGNKTGASTYVIDAADYAAWRANFGHVDAGSGSGTTYVVPEPVALTTWLSAVLIYLLGQRRPFLFAADNCAKPRAARDH